MLRITVVSHYPKIGDTFEEQLLRRSLAQFDRKEIDLAKLEAVKDEVTRTVIEEQIDAGIEVVTDGEIRWDDAVTYLAGKIKGFSLTGLLRYFDTNTFYRQPVCEGALTSPQEGLVVKDFQFANTMSSVPLKALLTGPFTLAKLSRNKHYESTEEFGIKLAGILGEEIKLLEQAGATIVQFDEPALLNFKEEFPLFKKIWAKLAQSFPDHVETVLFLNFGNLEGVYPKILELPFTTLGLDFTTASANRKILCRADRAVPNDQAANRRSTDRRRANFSKKLLAGIIDARNTKMETEEEIRKRLEELLQIVSAEDLSVCPSHGLEYLPRESARRKLANLSKVVREFREAKVKV